MEALLAYQINLAPAAEFKAELFCRTLWRWLLSDRTGQKDEELIQSLIKGEAHAFNELFNRYAASVLGYTIKMMACSQSTAEDITQTVWEKVVKSAPQFSGECFKAWLFTIARNTALHELEKRGRWDSNELNEDDLSATDSEGEVQTAEELLIQLSQRRELIKRIDSLPDRQRVVLLAWLDADKSQKEIAEQLGMTVKTFEMLLVRAKKALLGGTE